MKATANMGRPVANRNKVPQKMWRRWSNHARRVFNTVMMNMRPSLQWQFLHPQTTAVPKEQWNTTRWNAACIAASAADGLGKLVDKAKKKAKRRG
jgi:hypothetical protein